MIRFLFSAAAAALLYCAPAAEAGVISRACLKADRQAASPALCRCIQGVANSSLTRAERKRASKFFADPQQAQDTRQSSRSGDEKFWLRYKAFGQAAQAQCG